MGTKEIHEFFSSASEATVGTEYKVINSNPLMKMLVAISGSHASKTVLFQAKGLTGDYTPLLCTNLKSGATGSQTTAVVDELWSMPLAGLEYTRCELSAISGSATIIGKVVQ